MTKEEFYKTDKLYHYTSFNTALNILETNELWFNHLSNLNDINELYRPLFFDKVTKETELLAQRELEMYQQVSLTMDSKRYGFDIPAMWGHYGDKGRGVCLIFDKQKLINSISSDIYHRRITYVSPNHSFSMFIKSDGSTIIPLSKKEIKESFFKKTRDWSYEQEYRLLIKTVDYERHKLPLNDSLIAIVMRDAYVEDESHNVRNSVKYNILKKIKSPSCLILNYNIFLELRFLQYMDAEEFEKPDDDTIWSSMDNDYEALKNGNAKILVDCNIN